MPPHSVSLVFCCAGYLWKCRSQLTLFSSESSGAFFSTPPFLFLPIPVSHKDTLVDRHVDSTEWERKRKETRNSLVRKLKKGDENKKGAKEKKRRRSPAGSRKHAVSGEAVQHSQCHSLNNANYQPKTC